MNKRQLYENIIKSIAKQVKKSINEAWISPTSKFSPEQRFYFEGIERRKNGETWPSIAKDFNQKFNQNITADAIRGRINKIKDIVDNFVDNDIDETTLTSYDPTIIEQEYSPSEVEQLKQEIEKLKNQINNSNTLNSFSFDKNAYNVQHAHVGDVLYWDEEHQVNTLTKTEYKIAECVGNLYRQPLFVTVPTTENSEHIKKWSFEDQDVMFFKKENDPNGKSESYKFINIDEMKYVLSNNKDYVLNIKNQALVFQNRNWFKNYWKTGYFINGEHTIKNEVYSIFFGSYDEKEDCYYSIGYQRFDNIKLFDTIQKETCYSGEQDYYGFYDDSIYSHNVKQRCMITFYVVEPKLY